MKRLYEAIQYSHIHAVLTEAGLYTVMCLSRKPHALQFRRWVTCEVLPSIRKTGVYIHPQVAGGGMEGLLQKIFQRLQNLETSLETLRTAVAECKAAVESLVKPETDAYQDNLEKIQKIVEGMTQVYALSPEESAAYFTALCREYRVRLPDRVLEASQPEFYDLSQIAEKLGVSSPGGKPHALAIGAIIRRLGLNQEKYQKRTHFIRHGHQDVTTKYSERVIPLIYGWLKEQNFPELLPPLPADKGEKTRKFKVKYKESPKNLGEGSLLHSE